MSRHLLSCALLIVPLLCASCAKPTSAPAPAVDDAGGPAASDPLLEPAKTSNAPVGESIDLRERIAAEVGEFGDGPFDATIVSGRATIEDGKITAKEPGLVTVAVRAKGRVVFFAFQFFSPITVTALGEQSAKLEPPLLLEPAGGVDVEIEGGVPPYQIKLVKSENAAFKGQPLPADLKYDAEKKRLTAGQAFGVASLAIEDAAGNKALFDPILVQPVPGALDRSFGTEGYSALKGGEARHAVEQLDLSADEKALFVFGTSIRGDRAEGIAVRRMTADGKPDERYGKKGVALLAGEATLADARAGSAGEAFLLLRREGKVVVAKLARSGAVDRKFGREGMAETSLPSTGLAQALLVLPNGALFVAGASEEGFAIAQKITKEGRLDTTFGENGLLRLPISIATENSLLLQKAKIVIAGSLRASEGETKTALLRLDASGVADEGFGEKGILTLAPTERPCCAKVKDEYATSVALARDGGLIVGAIIAQAPAVAWLDRDGGKAKWMISEERSTRALVDRVHVVPLGKTHVLVQQGSAPSTVRGPLFLLENPGGRTQPAAEITYFSEANSKVLVPTPEDTSGKPSVSWWERVASARALAIGEGRIVSATAAGLVRFWGLEK